ncbi:PEP-CTERM sorting domain-containing protein [Chlorogloea sp. CCALA 695]|uniref:PEP-CTERM sorting domain-containing protein n=1 Tax=Chlorogloea sp. CCALA 695 TaxID=2107693 RepID=UPI0018EABC41|nr:PEP-CTERM sorting domain-containing protein [Chlorogloea sp. CCALA 695]
MSILAKSSTLAASVLGLLSLSTVLVAAPSQAAVINGSFESGDFTGWEKIGTAAVDTNAYGVDTTDGYYQASLVTNSKAPAVSIEKFLGLTRGSLSTLGNGVANSGAAIKQTFTASAGDVVSFDWNFLTNEGTPNARNNDFAFFSLTGLTELADTTVSFVDSLSEFREETGYQTTSYTIATAGNYTLGFGVINSGDRKVQSGLLVDNVSSEPVPEPASMLGILAFGALGGKKLLKRRQEKQA